MLDGEADVDELGLGAKAKPQTDMSVLAVFSAECPLAFDSLAESLTRIAAFVRLVPRAMCTQLYRAAPVPTVSFSVVIPAHARLTVVGSERCPIGAVDEILLQLSGPSTVGEIRAGAEIADGVVDDLVLGLRKVEAGRLADHLLRGRRGGPV